MIRIGYACINMDIKNTDYKTCRMDNITEIRLSELIEHNLNVLEQTIDYNIEHNNSFFRISSSLIPYGSSSLNTIPWWYVFAANFERIKKKIDGNNIRISCHPGQYTLLNSPNPNVIEASLKDLEYHAKLMMLLSDNPNSKMVIHIGGVYGDKKSARERFISTANTKLSQEIKKRLIIENDDKLYTVEDVLIISKATGLPVVFDNLHHECNPSLSHLSSKEIVGECLKTWHSHEKPKVHYSQQDQSKRVGAHTETINLNQFEADFLKYYEGHNLDIMLEVKDKNRSFIRVNALMTQDKKILEKEWARYKYRIMYHSQSHYNDLRKMFRELPVNPITFYTKIDEALTISPIMNQKLNAYEHVWGYFKKIADEKERSKYNDIKTSILNGYHDERKIRTFLLKMLSKYPNDYLENSYFFK